MDYSILIVIIYMVLFLSPIIISAILEVSLIVAWFVIIISIVLPNVNNKSQPINKNLIDKVGFQLGRLCKKLEELSRDISKFIPFLEKIDVKSHQKKITKKYFLIIDSIVSGAKKGTLKSKKEGQGEESLLDNAKLWRKVINYLISILGLSFLILFFMIILCFPVNILILMLITM